MEGMRMKSQVSQSCVSETPNGNEARINRRMQKLVNQKSKYKDLKCPICLGDTESEIAKLECGHWFCLKCLTKWWKTQSSCPCCRSEFDVVVTNSGKEVRFDDLSEKASSTDSNFIMHCEFCWAEIEPIEEMRICQFCRSIYCHTRCLNFSCNRWLCNQCAHQEDGSESEEEVRRVRVSRPNRLYQTHHAINDI